MFGTIQAYVCHTLKLTAKQNMMVTASNVKTDLAFKMFTRTMKRALLMDIAKQNALINTVMCVVQVRKNALNVLLATV